MAKTITLEWHEIAAGTSVIPVYKGWLINVGNRALTFIPDPNHEWKIEKDDDPIAGENIKEAITTVRDIFGKSPKSYD